MAESPLHNRALEILADPHASEKDWMGAVAILGGKAPAIRRRPREIGKKTVRFCKRTLGLSLAYVALFSAYGLITFSQPLSLSMVLLVTGWAALEAAFGAFTALAFWMMIAHFGSIISLNPFYQTTWMVVLINVFAYAKFNWRPYVFVPINHLIDQQMKRKRASVLISSTK